MTGTTVFPSDGGACVSAAPRSPRVAPGAGAEATGGMVGDGEEGGGDEGEGGHGEVAGVPCGTTIGGKRYMRHQFMPPGLRSEPATVRRADVCGSSDGEDASGPRSSPSAS